MTDPSMDPSAPSAPSAVVPAPLRATLADALAALPGAGGERFAAALVHGSLLVEVYRPGGPDQQDPHDRDELYVVVTGTGRLRRAGVEVDCGPGDLLFVPAGVEHRFAQASADFVVWVVFYGPPGGEAATGAGAVAAGVDAAGDDARYTHGHHASVLASHRWRTATNSAPHLLPHLRPGQRVLDVGCGPGTITLDLAEAVAPGEVVGIDRSPDVVAVARQAAVERGLGNVSFRVGDVYALDEPDGSFDVVHAHQVLQHLADPVRALVELRRVCRSGGLVAVRDADYAAMAWAPPDPQLDRWLERYRTAARANGGEPDAGRHLLGWVRAAGFSSIQPGASTWCFATPEDRRWWGGTWAERVSSSALAEQLMATGITAHDLSRMAAAWRRWADHPDGWFLVPSAEVLARP